MGHQLRAGRPGQVGRGAPPQSLDQPLGFGDRLFPRHRGRVPLPARLRPPQPPPAPRIARRVGPHPRTRTPTPPGPKTVHQQTRQAPTPPSIALMMKYGQVWGESWGTNPTAVERRPLKSWSECRSGGPRLQHPLTADQRFWLRVPAPELRAATLGSRSTRAPKIGRVAVRDSARRRLAVTCRHLPV